MSFDDFLSCGAVLIPRQPLVFILQKICLMVRCSAPDSSLLLHSYKWYAVLWLWLNAFSPEYRVTQLVTPNCSLPRANSALSYEQLGFLHPNLTVKHQPLFYVYSFRLLLSPQLFKANVSNRLFVNFFQNKVNPFMSRYRVVYFYIRFDTDIINSFIFRT